MNSVTNLCNVILACFLSLFMRQPDTLHLPIINTVLCKFKHYKQAQFSLNITKFSSKHLNKQVAMTTDVLVVGFDHRLKSRDKTWRPATGGRCDFVRIDCLRRVHSFFHSLSIRYNVKHVYLCVEISNK